MMEAGSDGKETEGCANGISRGSGEGWGKRRERSRATRNEEKEMRWSTTSQGVVTGSGPFACPKKAKRLDRDLWASWREKPLLSTSKKFPFHTHGENLIREAAEQFRRDLSETLYQPDTMLALSRCISPTSRRRWGGSLAGVLNLEVTGYDSDARGNRSVVDCPLTINRSRP